MFIVINYTLYYIVEFDWNVLLVNLNKRSSQLEAVFCLLFLYRERATPQVEEERILGYITWHRQRQVSGQGQIRSRG